MGDTLDDPPSGDAPCEPRRDKPQTLAGIQPTQNLKSISCNTTHLKHSSASFSASSTTNTSSTCMETSCDEVSAARLARNRARSRASGSDVRDHSCDGLTARRARASTVGSSGNGNDAECSGNNDDGTSRRESLHFEDTSPSGTSFGKALFGRSSRYPSSGGATTRKCVLTLDGYSYVIVASTPENRLTRDDPTGTGGSGVSGLTTSSGNASERRTPGGAVGSICTSSGNTFNERSSSPKSSSSGGAFASGSGGSGNSNAVVTASGSPGSLTHTQAINGQVARHGSLTIVRRSNSRKSFSQLEAQHTILSPSATSVGGTSGATLLNTPSTPLNDPFTTSTGTTTTATTLDNRTKDNCNSYLAATETTPLLHNTFSSKETCSAADSSTSYTSSTITAATTTEQKQHNLQYSLRMQTGSNAATSNASNNATTSSNTNSSSNITTADRMSPTTTEGAPIASAIGAGDADGQNVTGSDNAPITPTSAACSVDLATENLPAVDTPDACDKAAMRLRSLLRLLNNGEISSEVLQKNLHYAARVLEAVFLDETNQPVGSSEKNTQRCNSNCKNLNCNQHSHENHHCSSSSNIQNNNNSNSSCSLQQNNNKEHTNNLASHNQTTFIEGRTKGVSLAPQTHSGPTGPPGANTLKLDDSEENALTTAATTKVSAVSATETDSSSKGDVGSGGGDGTQNRSSNSSSNKASVQRQRRLRTPVWARSMSTNKTYSFLNMNLNYFIF